MKRAILNTVIFFIFLCTVPVVFAQGITIVGTGSGAAILKAIGDAFTVADPDIGVDVPKSIGSGGGIMAVGRDEALIGRVARKIKTKEEQFGLTWLPIAKMPIVFFVHKDVGLEDLSVKQILDIYSGKISEWKDVGGKSGSIRVIRREEGDSSLSVLQKSFPGFEKITITQRSKTLYSDPDTLDMVEQKKGAIAFGTYGNASGRQVKILSIEGKYPRDAGYPYFGTLALVFKEKNRKGAIGKFIEFAVSGEAAEAIQAAGGQAF